ncbi:MAG: TonB family protein [Acidobacteriaceae bacterium]|nr:TonB family protein [Acidobacteriaceae bacterium]
MLQRRLHSVNPIIPPEDFAGESGGVVASATIDRDGKVVKLKALSGPEKRRRYCLDAFKKWTFKPYLLNGEPVFVQTTFTVDF